MSQWIHISDRLLVLWSTASGYALPRNVGDLPGQPMRRRLRNDQITGGASGDDGGVLGEGGPELAALWTACGACFNACPMVDHVGLRGSDPKSVTDGLRGLARGESGYADTLAWVSACAKSDLYVAACPERSAGLG